LNWKTPLTLLVLVGLLLGAAFYGWRSLAEPAEVSDPPTPRVEKKPKCTTVEEFRKGERIVSRDVIVNVFNAGSTTGLATATLDSLVAKGFRRGEADNAPESLAATNVTIVRGKSDDPTVRLVAMQFKGDVKFDNGPDVAPGVDVVIGDDFRSVDAEAQRVLRMRKTVKTCTSIQGDRGSAS